MPPDERKILCDLWADKALDFMERAAEDKRPFFLYLAATAPHAPHLPDDTINGAPFSEGAKLANGKLAQNNRQKLVYANDLILGQLMEQTRRLGIEDDTIVIFTADNGGGAPGVRTKAMGDYKGYKGLGYEGGNRMPFIVKWPGKIKPGSVSAGLVSQVDFFRTFASIVGEEELPAGAAPDSLNLLPVWTGQGASPRGLHVATKHKQPPYAEYEDGSRNVAILDADGNKLIMQFNEGNAYEPVEFYRLGPDPGERENRVESPEFSDTIRRLVDEFEAIRNRNVGSG